MLTNQMYIGNMVQGKYGSVSYKTKINKPKPRDEWIVVEDTHEGIIDLELWDKVQSMLKARAKPFGNGTVGIFAKKVRCAYCEYVMRTAKKKAYRYLKCSTKYAHKDACPGAFIPQHELEEIILGELKSVIEEYADRDEIDKHVHFDDSLESRIKDLDNQLSACQKQIASYSKAVRDLYLDKAGGIIAESEFLALSREFYSEKDKREARAKELRQHISKLSEMGEKAEDKMQIITKYLSVEKLEREHVLELIESIHVGRRNKNTGKIPIKIVWSF
jgi:hypothetical protein